MLFFKLVFGLNLFPTKAIMTLFEPERNNLLDFLLINSEYFMSLSLSVFIYLFIFIFFFT